MVEKMPEFKRPEPFIFGKASPETKEEYKRIILERFGENHYKNISEKKRKILEYSERQKMLYEKESIKHANDITNALISEFGQQAFDVPEQNIHILPKEAFQMLVGSKNKDRFAATFHEQQLIAINADLTQNPIRRTATILHEITHLKSFFGIEAHEDFHKTARVGFRTMSSHRKEEKIGFFDAFIGIDEAIVSEIEKRYLPEIIQKNRFLANEYQWENSEAAIMLKNKIASQERRDVEEVMLVMKDGKNIIYGLFPYYEQRRVLYYIIDKIYEDNRERFNSKEDIMKLFFRSCFSGKKLNILRLIDKSFGRGTFMVVAMMDYEKSSANLLLDYLIKKRKR